MKKLLLIDSSVLLYRAYHALPPLSGKDGEERGAMYGFLLLFFKAIKDIKPDFIVACFDHPGKTFRHKKFKDYKAQRPKMPKELSQQIPKIKRILKEFNISIIEKEGFEADDLIATISEKEKKKEVVIMTGDTDLFQLVNKNIKVYTSKRKIKETMIYDEKEIFSRFSLIPEQLVDFKTLTGDSSDNVPGVPGVGKKTATDLLKKYKNLEEIYKKTEELKPRVKKSLIDNKKQVFLSKELIQVKRDVPFKLDIKKSKFENFDIKKAEEVLKEFNFKSLINRLSEIFKSEKQPSLI